MAVSELAGRVTPDLWLEEIDARLRCTRCGKRGQAQLIRIELADE
jgi:hypothetical protein